MAATSGIQETKPLRSWPVPVGGGSAPTGRGALRHDAMTRMIGRYDARAALGQVTRHYTLRTEAHRVTPDAGQSTN